MTPPCGLICLLKPPGMTSHDAVSMARVALGERRVGHAGTLDPAAAGVLVLAVRRATRLIDLVMAGEKQYLCEVTFGTATDSADAAGTITHTGAVPDLAAIQAALPAFIGTLDQTPPAFSAIKINGQPAYQAARRGEEVSIAPRRVQIHFADVVSWQSSRLMLRVGCSKGTYLRSLARDLGQAVGSPAHCSYLLRERSGGFSLGDAVTCEAFVADPAAHLLPPTFALPDAPIIELTPAQAQKIAVGNAIPATAPEGPCWLRYEGQWMALAHACDGQIAVTFLL